MNKDYDTLSYEEIKQILKEEMEKYDMYEETVDGECEELDFGT